MALHPVWKGYLRLSLVSCPVRLYDATSTGERITFHLLNPKTRHRVRMHAVDEETGGEVPREQLVRGYEVDKGRYVVVSAEELDGIKIESSEVIAVDRFIAQDAIEPIYFQSWFYLAPDGQVADEPYRVIQQALRNRKMVALGRLVLAAREHGVALMPHGKGLQLATLRPAAEIESDKPYFGAIGSGPLDRAMVKLAERIIEQKAGKLDLGDFAEDRYQAALHALIERKMKGEPSPPPKAAKPPSNVVNLMDALKRSVATDRKAPPPAKRGVARRRSAKARGATPRR